MTGAAWAFLVVAAVIAAVDWWAVATDRRSVEYVAKPATMIALGAVALSLDPASAAARVWFVGALGCSLAGDVFLMLPDRDRWFTAGLGAFLVGHLAYVAGLAVAGVEATPVLVGVVVVAILVPLAAPPLVRGARAVDPRLGGPVMAYVAAISAMVVLAVGSGVAVAVAGAALFYLSDFTLGWSRFVRPFRGDRLVVMTTYHLGQALLVVSLVVAR